MIALVLAATLAWAEAPAAPGAPADETYVRLFGAAGAATPAATATPAPSAWGFAGPLALLAAAGVAAWKLKRSVPTVAGARPIDVVGRQALGDRGALVLVDVIDAEGERRRLLVGTGGGPPTLVADLGLAPLPTRADARVDARADAPADPPRPPRNVADEVLAERRPDLAHAEPTRPEAARPDFARVAARHGLP